MGFLRNLFGKKQPVRDPSLGMSIVELQRKANEKLGLLRQLAGAAKFDRDSMTTYLSMLEQTGIEVDRQRRYEALNAGELMVPKPQADGSAMDGFEQLRQSFMQLHMEELSMIIKLVEALPPDPASAHLLKRIADETGELERLWGRHSR